MVDEFDKQCDYAEKLKEKQLDDVHRSFTHESVIEEQKKDTWCQELLKELGVR